MIKGSKIRPSTKPLIVNSKNIFDIFVLLDKKIRYFFTEISLKCRVSTMLMWSIQIQSPWVQFLAGLIENLKYNNHAIM